MLEELKRIFWAILLDGEWRGMHLPHSQPGTPSPSHSVRATVCEHGQYVYVDKRDRSRPPKTGEERGKGSRARFHEEKQREDLVSSLAESFARLSVADADELLDDPEWLKSCPQLASLRDLDKAVRESKAHVGRHPLTRDGRTPSKPKSAAAQQQCFEEMVKAGSRSLADVVATRMVEQCRECRANEKDARSQLERDLKTLEAKLKHLLEHRKHAQSASSSKKGGRKCNGDNSGEPSSPTAGVVPSKSRSSKRVKPAATGRRPPSSAARENSQSPQRLRLTGESRKRTSKDVKGSDNIDEDDRVSDPDWDPELAELTDSFVQLSISPSQEEEEVDVSLTVKERETGSPVVQTRSGKSSGSGKNRVPASRTSRVVDVEEKFEDVFSDVADADSEVETGNDFERIESLWKQYFEKKELLAKKLLPGFKPDVDVSGSSWTVKDFSQYITPHELARYSPDTRRPHDLSRHIVDGVVEQIRTYVECIHGWSSPKNGSETGLDNLCSTQMLEAVSRTFIDAVVLPLARRHFITLSMEESLKSDFAVNNKFDYLLFKDGRYFGVVEAKRVGASFTKAFVQTSLQLFLLRCSESHAYDASARSARPYPKVGVITNGESYVFVKLERARLLVSDVFRGSTVAGLETIVYAMHHLFSE